MKQVFICFLLLLYRTVSLASSNTDSLIIELNWMIKNAHIYDNKKLERIYTLQNLLHDSANHLSEPYTIYVQLYEEYMYYNYDSAMYYAGKLQMAAQNKNDLSLIIDAKLKTIFIMLSSGMFIETSDSLNMLSVKYAGDSLKAAYFTLMGLLYYNLADFNGDRHSVTIYNNKANWYVDSALAFYAPNSFEYIYHSALRSLKTGNADSALFNLNMLIESYNLSHHQMALAASTIGGIFISQGREAEAKPFLIKASIADIQSSTKETLALLTLASIMYKEGNTDEAVLYIEKANADATFYNARLRKVQIGAILPLIEGTMINTIKIQKENLQYSLLVLSILVLLLAGFAIIIRNQLIKIKAARKSLIEANGKQRQINQELLEANALKEKYTAQLQEINRQLSEANKIKEEYIGYYFNLDTEFLARIEKIISAIDKKLTERKWEEIKFIVKSVDLKKEKEELLKNFDKVFLRLFPNFVNQFDTLFKEEDRMVLKEDQLLNTELRIFALIRLGITDNEKIAEILDYSINTIYSKKTKIRSKTIVNKDEFERRIVEITTLNS